MKVNWITPKEILDLEKELGFELEANERAERLHGLKRFYVLFRNGHAMESSCLVGYSGSGDTIDEALKDYCNHISGKRMAFNAYSQNRTEVQLPRLIHTKLLGY